MRGSGTLALPFVLRAVFPAFTEKRGLRIQEFIGPRHLPKTEKGAVQRPSVR